MKCTVTNISKVTQTVFPEAGSESIAAGDKFTGEFSAERIHEMTHNQPGKFAVETEKANNANNANNAEAPPSNTIPVAPPAQQQRRRGRGKR